MSTIYQHFQASRFPFLLFIFCCLAGCGQEQASANPTPFTVHVAHESAVNTSIVLPYDATTQTGFNWDAVSKLPYYSQDDNMPVQAAVHYLLEAVQRLTGQELPIVSGTDLSRGIVLTTLALAPAEVRADLAVQKTLQNSGADSYNANEAFYIRSEPDRVLLVANTPDGLMAGVVELMESVGYEVLGMGPNWTHVPNLQGKSLIFNIEHAGRPGFYIRNLWATSGQSYGVGTLTSVPNPADETVRDSYQRWRVGTRMAGQSMPNFPGHAMQGFHDAVLHQMRETKTTAGFLVEKTTLGLDTERPAASSENKGHLWINTDAKDTPAAHKTFISDGEKWVEDRAKYVRANLDLSAPLVRKVILDALKARAEKHFQSAPEKTLVIGTDPEDGGGYATLGKLLSEPNWYPEYLKREGLEFGQPYVLHNFKGLNQPREIWDANAPSDTVFGFNNWLLREFDKWIDSLPAAERVTAASKEKKTLVRASLYSYNFHDVPPNFNLDPRIRVMIASYPKHRGWGKWKNFKSQIDMAEAYQRMLPREPAGDYWIISISYYKDFTVAGIGGSQTAETIANRIHEEYQAGFRALSVETDFNFGKQGLEYYLYTKMLWNPQLTAKELDALRDRWLQRAFGSGWREMKEYYDFMAPQNYVINGTNNWAKAIRLIDAASRKIDGAKEPDAQHRIDDIKQYWYFYYLIETDQGKSNSPAFKELMWKGQMSYVTAMHVPVRRFFNTNKVKDAVGPEFNTGPAHYTHEETQQWWSKILDAWQVTPISDFAGAILADGTAANKIDLNEVIAVREFAQANPNIPFSYNGSSSSNRAKAFLTTASQMGEAVGFTVFWPSGTTTHLRARDVFYGVSRWNPEKRSWEELVDKTMTSVASYSVTGKDAKEYQQAQVSYAAPQPGTYLIEVENAGDSAKITTLNYDLASAEYSDIRGQTYFENLIGHTQSPVYFYIPKGTKSIDLEVWDAHNNKKLQLHNGLPATGLKKTRVVDIGARGAHVVKLDSGEDGSLAMITGNGFAFPYLYSVPMLWAKSPAALLVPRAIAAADGLTSTTDR